ncbi:hypothetical protein MMG00_01860 [Ignatzschineria rhizosphaerae]|uniref:DUF5666 domain-containing protein n=1 Tax=Ignatzschineria rhizosphaerae TaxID=2923279 RepID=A0ABY3X4K8_9GAMM|nr:hypothetical protein [Ignatzschineria rhizosphaerae]UNM96634.1 hypothetical protein MMG00_01860 [Ignatzschineria rhizosphaerae]
MKKLGLLMASLALLAGCATGVEDGKGSYSGKGRVVSIVVNEEGNSEVGVETTDRGHVPVVVKGEIDIFPGQNVKVQRNSRGLGSITAL